MPTFLTRAQVYRMLQRELPEGVYPDGPATAFFSTADNDAIAGIAASGYSNLSIVYDNYFPQLAVEKLSDWEMAVFGAVATSALTVLERQQRVLQQLRAQFSISYASILSQIEEIFEAAGLEFDLVNWNGGQGGNGEKFGGGAWDLEFSALDADTYLSPMDPVRSGGMDCSLDYLAHGLTAAQLQAIQETAYTYEVRIIGHADASFLADLDATLKRIEPARSTHYIYNDFPGPLDPP